MAACSGSKRNVISYSLFLSGNVSMFGKYIAGLFQNWECRDKYFPGWTIVIYYDQSVCENASYGVRLLKMLQQQSIVELHLVKGLENQPVYVRAAYRFLAGDDVEHNAIVLFRDLDSPLTQLDAMYVAEWINANHEPVLQYYAPDQFNYHGFASEMLHVKTKQWEKYFTFPPQSTETTITKANSFAAGGTALNLKLLLKDTAYNPCDYTSFVNSKLDGYIQEFKGGNARGFDEVYLSHCLGKVSAYTVPMVLIDFGDLRGRWYVLHDLILAPANQAFTATILSHCRPLLDFVQGKYYTSKRISNLLHCSSDQIHNSNKRVKHK
jgi:hypothetical protein